MTKREPLPSIRSSDLEGAIGGASRVAGGSSSWQTQQAIQSITDSLSDLKNSNNNTNNSLTKWLPFVMMAKIARGG
jgi:hypothetical protein